MFYCSLKLKRITISCNVSHLFLICLLVEYTLYFYVHIVFISLLFLRENYHLLKGNIIEMFKRKGWGELSVGGARGTRKFPLENVLSLSSLKFFLYFSTSVEIFQTARQLFLCLRGLLDETNVLTGCDAAL